MLIAVFTCCSVCMFAQEKSNANNLTTIEGKTQRMVDYLHKQLELNGEQLNEMYNIQLQAQQQFQEIQSIKETDTALYTKKEQGLLTDTDARIERLLDENQIAIYKELVSKKRGQERVNKRLEKAGKKTAN